MTEPGASSSPIRQRPPRAAARRHRPGPDRRGRGPRSGRLGDDRRLDGRGHLPRLVRAAAPRRGPVGRRPRLVGRRPVRPARPPALERQAVRGHHARHGRGRGRHRRRSTAGRPHPRRADPSVPRRPRRSAPAASAAWCAAADWPRSCAPRRPRGRRRLAGLRPDPARGRAGRARAVGVPGFGGVRVDRARRLAIPAPTHIEPHVERVTLNPAVRRGGARRPRGRRDGAAKAAVLGEVFGDDARSAPLAGPAGPARRRDLDPRRGGGGRPARGDRAGRRATGHDPPRRPADGRRHRRRVAGVVARDVRRSRRPSGRRRPDAGWPRSCCRAPRRGSPSTRPGRVVGMMALSRRWSSSCISRRTGSGGASARACSISPRSGARAAWTCTASRSTLRARRFYERRGFVADRRSATASRQRGAPARHPLRLAPGRRRSVERIGPATGRRSRCSPTASGPPLVLVHGAAADHTTFRVRRAAARRARSRSMPIDRRGRGASGDTPPYAIEREFEDVAAVVERSPPRPARAGRRLRALVRRSMRARGGAPDGRHRAESSRYEGAPAAGPDARTRRPTASAEALAACDAAGRLDELLADVHARRRRA